MEDQQPGNTTATIKQENEELEQLRELLGKQEQEVLEVEEELKMNIVERKYREANECKQKLKDAKRDYLEVKAEILKLVHEQAVQKTIRFGYNSLE